MTRKTDTLAILLLLGGIALATVAALALPALHVRDASKSLLDISAWEAVPWATKLKLLFLLAAAAVAFLPRFASLRVPVTAAAAVMMFMPALAALTAGVYQWSSVRAELVQISGSRAPWIDPGWGIVVLLVAALMLIGSLVRSHRAAAAAAA